MHCCSILLSQLFLYYAVTISFPAFLDFSHPISDKNMKIPKCPDFQWVFLFVGAAVPDSLLGRRSFRPAMFFPRRVSCDNPRENFALSERKRQRWKTQQWWFLHMFELMRKGWSQCNSDSNCGGSAAKQLWRRKRVCTIGQVEIVRIFYELIRLNYVQQIEVLVIFGIE